MIGFYSYTVILTYLSLAVSMIGITQVVEGHFRTAILCLALSGLLDMFDGKVARTKKNRTDDEKLFGIQIDSLCDMVCFGAFPALFCYYLGVRGLLGVTAVSYYCICSVIRLAFFNVLETRRQSVEGGANKFYHGLPITSMAIILPISYLLNFAVDESVFRWILFALLFVVGTFFVVDIKLKKPSNKFLIILVLVVAAAVIVILTISDTYHVALPRFIERSLFHMFWDK
ncbi:MAG: CDP-diacylglycerol--serine O-phosphatidyltransferase [Lachnospiraceae bacterium]|nr:CDP-diacylglycerol--serine O-phosphatidyltransferase [Lachnospiraceae bacterium]